MSTTYKGVTINEPGDPSDLSFSVGVIEQAVIKKLIDNVGYRLSNYASFALAVAAIGSTQADLVIDTPGNVTSNTVLPSTLRLKRASGGYLTIASGKTLTINNMDEDIGSERFFYGTGTVTISAGAVSLVCPEWFGAVGDGATDDSAAIQKAIDCGTSVVKLSQKTYAIASNVSIANKTSFSFVGSGKRKTYLIWTGTDGGTMLTFRGSWFSTISDMGISGNRSGSAHEHGAGICLEMPCYDSGVDTYVSTRNSLKNLCLEDCRSHTGSIALKLGDTSGTQLDALNIRNCFLANTYKLCTIQGNVTFDISFYDCSFSTSWGDDTGGISGTLPNKLSVQISDRCGIINFTSCQFVGGSTNTQCPSTAHVTRDNLSGQVVFRNCLSEMYGPFFKGDDDTGFTNTTPVMLDSCSIGFVQPVPVVATFGITTGSPDCTIADTSAYYVGMTVTGTGIPTGAIISSITANTKITLNKNSTATNASASLTAYTSVILHQQAGSFIIVGGVHNVSDGGVYNFSRGGSVGSTGGLVEVIGGEYSANHQFIVAGGSTLHRTTLIGAISKNNGTWTLDTSGNTAQSGQAIVTGPVITSDYLQMANNKPVKMRKADTTAVEVLNVNASDNIELGKDLSAKTITVSPKFVATQTSGHLFGSGSALSGHNTTMRVGTSDSTLYRHLGLASGGGSASAQFCTQTTIDLAATPLVIAGVELDCLLIVKGVNNAVDKKFIDILLASSSADPVVISALNTAGAPVNRSYTYSGSGVLLAMSSDTYTINCFWIQMANR